MDFQSCFSCYYCKALAKLYSKVTFVDWNSPSAMVPTPSRNIKGI